MSTVVSYAAVAAVVIVLLVVFFVRRRRRCPYGNPLCSGGKPCLHCYRDLYNSKMVEREPDQSNTPQQR